MVSIFVRNSVAIPCVNVLDFDNTVPNLISLPGFIPWIKVEKVVLSRVINADSLSDLKLYKVDKPVPNEFYVSNTFKPDIYNVPFIFVVLSKLVNPLTFSDDNNVVLF